MRYRLFIFWVFFCLTFLFADCAMDANGGRDNPYMNQNIGHNDNLLYKLEDTGSGWYRIIPKVEKNKALDANGGRDNPYFNKIEVNDNLLFGFQKVGDRYVIIPKVKRSACLDANGGRGNPYFNDNPDRNNPNHLWRLEKVGYYYRLRSDVP